MTDMLNPYIAGAPVVEASMFFGREDVFSWIERSLEGKYVHHILVLHGQRRVGKTSVLKQIPNFLSDKYIQVFFDLQGRTGATLDRFLWWLASEIARTLRREHNINIPKPDRNAFEDTEYLINGFLPGLRPLLGDRILLLTFDEFDSLDRPEIRETLARPLISYLRRLIEVEGLNFIFSIGSSGDKLENMQASYTEFFKSALYRKISFLTANDCQRLITKPVEDLIKYEMEAVARINKITSGHPYFTQLMCHELFSRCQKTGARTIRADDVEAVMEDVVERGTVNLKFVWDEASDLEKWILASLAQMDGGSNQELARALTAQRVRFSEPDLNSAVIHLRDKDVITEDNLFVVHLMRLWLVANRPTDRVREELEEVNPIANRFIEIGDEYRDRGDIHQAVEYYQQALNVNPGNLKAQTNIASVHLDQKEFDGAAAAFELALKIDDEDVIAKTGYCEANLALGEQARAEKDYEEAINYYQQVLKINPDHADASQQLEEIQKIVSAYEEAQGAIRENQYERAVELLQGIIVVDPTYKATTRLLTEAVEARKAVPPWRQKWILPGAVALAVVVLGILFGPRALTAVSTAIANRPAAATELPVSAASTSTQETSAESQATEPPSLVAVATDTVVPSPTVTSEPTGTPEPPSFYEPILDYIETEPPTFEDDFSTQKKEWGKNIVGKIPWIYDFIRDGVLQAPDSLPTNPYTYFLSSENFAISVDWALTEGRSITFVFRSQTDETAYYKYEYIRGGDWNLMQNKGFGEFRLRHGSFQPVSGSESIWRTNAAGDKWISTPLNNFVFIARDENLAIYVNGDLILEFNELESYGNWNFFQNTGGQNITGGDIMMDNFKFWNLDGVEFSTAPTTATPMITPIPAWVTNFVEPMLERINNVNPDFTEDFSNPKNGWELIDGADGSFQIEAGVARLSVDKEGSSHFMHQTIDTLTDRDFIMEMDARIVEGEAAIDLWTHFIFNEDPSDSQNVGFLAQPAESTWSVTIDSPEGRNSFGGEGIVSPVGQYTHITIILTDQKVAFSINGNPVAYFQDPFLDEPGNFHFNCGGGSTGGVCEYDNIKIWKLPK